MALSWHTLGWGACPPRHCGSSAVSTSSSTSSTSSGSPKCCAAPSRSVVQTYGHQFGFSFSSVSLDVTEGMSPGSLPAALPARHCSDACRPHVRWWVSDGGGSAWLLLGSTSTSAKQCESDLALRVLLQAVMIVLATIASQADTVMGLTGSWVCPAGAQQEQPGSHGGNCRGPGGACRKHEKA